MNNDTINKLINKINFDIAGKFDLSVIKEYYFVPIDIQNDVLYVAAYSNSDKDKIIEYSSKIFSNEVSLIYMPKDNFEVLLGSYIKQVAPEPEVVIEEDNIIQSDEHIDFFDDDKDEMLFKDDDSDDIIDGSDISDDIDGEIDDIPDDDSVDLSDFDKDDDESSNQEKEIDQAIEKSQEQSGDIKKVKAPETKKLGEILIEEKLITEEQLYVALAESRAQKIPLGSILVKTGLVKIKDLKEALGAQMGLKYATTEQLKALPTAISILPEAFVKTNKVIPLDMTDTTLVVGMVNPNDKKVIDEIVYQTGIRPNVMLVTHVEFENFINTYYSNEKADTEDLLEQINQSSEVSNEQGELWQQVEQEVKDSDGAVSQFANKIITMAIDRRASDIHIEPMAIGYRVRLRIDGSLFNALKIPERVDSAVISRFKVLSKMNIAEHRRTQDGSFTLKYKNRAQDFRINTLPVAGREKMVIRILAPQMNAMQAKSEIIDIVGAHEDDLKKIKYLVSSPNGIVLTSGPTGSGKTTTLYAILKYLNSDSVNITTIEDPVEIKLEGINQSAVNPKAGITFANSLRAILRQDPDVILIGEIRDYETLEVAISASLTGHLVLSTVHTNSAAATVTRLIEMGAKDYLVSSTVAGIIAQRLVKRLCPNCKEEYYPTVDEAKKILTDPAEIKKLTQTKLYRPKGCANCKNTGYLGRLAVLEILVMNKELRKMVAQHAHDVEIEDYAIKSGMRTLRSSCFRHILEGNTSIDEQVRILGLAGE